MDDDRPRPDQLTFLPDERSTARRPMTPDEEAAARDAQRLTPDERLQGLLNLAQLRDALDDGGSARYTPSRPCPQCGSFDGEIRQSGNQLPVSCRRCRALSYNAPRVEVGLEPRSVGALRGEVSASQRARILERDHGRCILCGTADDLVVGHLLSVAEGQRVGATRAELGVDENLAAMCEGCNAGLGTRSISLRTLTVMLHLLRAERLESRQRHR